MLLLTARDAVDDRVDRPRRRRRRLPRQAVRHRRSCSPASARSAAADRRPRSSRCPPAAGIALDPDARTATRDGREIPLTAREAALLELLLRAGPRAVVTRERALEEVWDGEATENVVDRYVGYLRRKLGEPVVIHTVRGAGFTVRA